MSEINTPSPEGKTKPHIEILDFLRGLAALSVVLFHFSGSALPTIKPNALTDFFSFGKLGVQVFFVISGFIIPYSMYMARYSINGALKFIFKRLARIGPPAWIAVLPLFLIYYGSIAMNGRPIESMPWPGISLEAIIANLFFCYSILETGLYNEVYWTLEVEFQYYIFIAFMFPLILKFVSNELILSLLLTLTSLTYFVHFEKILFFRDNSFFILGILLFLYKTNLIKRNYFIYASICAMIICYSQQGLPASFAGIITFLVIKYVRFSNPITSFLGTISYSLYITHHFTGIASEFVLRNFTGMEVNEPLKVIMIFVYTGCAVIFAWLFYIFIEKPFIRISQKIKMKDKMTTSNTN